MGNPAANGQRQNTASGENFLPESHSKSNNPGKQNEPTKYRTKYNPPIS